VSRGQGTTGQQLQYFGQVTASVSHELKNVLAILGEHAGLLQDIAGMAKQGQDLDVERIGRLAGAMLAQIGRGDAIIKRMNRFAHSVDRERALVDLAGLVGLVAELFARTASTRGVTVEVQAGSQPVSMVTCPFALQTLLGALLDRLSKALPAGARLRIELAAPATAVQLRLAAPGAPPEVAAGVLEADAVKALLAALRASAAFSPENAALVITLPDNIDAATDADSIR